MGRAKVFANANKIFTVIGLDVKLDQSWLLIAALITWSLSQHHFPLTLPGQSPSTYFFMGLTAMVIFFASLLLHELAHSVVARMYNVPIKGITLFLFGGVAELDEEPKTARAEFWIAIAGPVMSLALAFGFRVLAGAAEVLHVPAPALTVMSYLATINLILAVFNLIPAFPLDGGRIFRAWMWHRTGDILRATELAARSGSIVAYTLMALGVLGLFQGAIVAGLWQIMIGGFILAAARAGYQAQLARSVFRARKVSDVMTRDLVVVDPDMTLSALVNDVMLPRRVSFVPVVDSSVLLGHVDFAAVTSVDSAQWPRTRVGDVFVGLTGDASVAPELPVEALMSRIRKTGQRKFLVVSDHTLCGVITISDLTSYLQMADVLRAQGTSPRRQ